MMNPITDFILLVTLFMGVLSSDQSQADNTYRYFYLYRNSDAYKSYHQEENESSKNEDEDTADFRLYEEERDYYLEGDEKDVDEEIYDHENDDSADRNSFKQD